MTYTATICQSVNIINNKTSCQDLAASLANPTVVSSLLANNLVKVFTDKHMLSWFFEIMMNVNERIRG